MRAPATSIILGYRDREIWRLSACLKSLLAGTVADIEVIVLDYGSTATYAQEAVHLCQGLGPRVRYAYAPVLGQPWNRSQALNLGADLASGQLLVFGDIDLVYPGNFIELVAGLARPGLKLNYRCRYLPQEATSTDFALLAAGYGQAPLSADTGLGLSILHSADFEKIGGYDERFMIWGIEDIALQYRALQAGMEHQWLDPALACTFHIWHPTAAASLPKNWYASMWSLYEETRSQPCLRLASWATLAEPRLSHDAKPIQTFIINADVVAHTARFMHGFTVAAPGQVLCLAADRHHLKTHPLIEQTNKVLKSVGISYRLGPKEFQERLWEPEDRYEAAMLYFLLYNRQYLADFMLESDEKGIRLTVVKK